jgi:hypothetical protein
MALSMDEQRVLAEIEQRLAAEEPSLAACMTNFRRPGPAAVLRSPRARIIGSLFTVLLVAMISLMVYAMIPFRAHGARTPAGHQATLPSQTQISASGGGPVQLSPVTASTGAGARQAGAANTAAAANKSGKATRTGSASAAIRNRAATASATSTGSKGKTSGTSAGHQ